MKVEITDEEIAAMLQMSTFQMRKIEVGRMMKEINFATIQSCIAIVQHHNVNLMGGEAAKQSIIKALLTMVEGEK